MYFSLFFCVISVVASSMFVELRCFYISCCSQRVAALVSQSETRTKELWLWDELACLDHTGVTNPKDGPNLEVEKFFFKIKRVTKFFKKWDAWFARSLKRCRLQGPMKHNYAALQKSFESQSTQCQQTILVKKIGMQRSMSAIKFLCLFPSLGKMKFWEISFI